MGRKEQKGDPGQSGKSIVKLHILLPLQTRITIPESKNLSLWTSGNPPTTIRWEFGRQIFNSKYTFPVKCGLLISNVNKSDDGSIQGIAENILRKDVSETQLLCIQCQK